jgi:hypothetical protein
VALNAATPAKRTTGAARKPADKDSIAG